MPSASHLALSPFELFREPLLVIGIIDGSEYKHLIPAKNKEADDTIHIQINQSLLEITTNALTELKEKYPRALVHHLLIFNLERTEDLLNLPENIKAIRLGTPASNFDVEEFFYEMTSLLLDEMASYSKTVQASHTISSPPASINIDGSVSYNAWPTSLTYSVSQVEKTKSGQLFPISSSTSSQENILIIPAQVANTGNARGLHDEQRKMSVPSNKNEPATTFDEMANFSVMTSNSVSKQKPERNTSNVESKRISVQGFGSGSHSERTRDMRQARIGSIVGQLLLLSGNWSEALNESVQSIIKCKFLDDYLWYAKGLETILICLLMQAWSGHELKV